MKIGEIPIVDVCAGKTWRFVGGLDETYEAPMEDWDGVEDAGLLEPEDIIIYSGIYVTEGGVRLLLLLKELGDADYGGDYCEHVGGRWRQVGLEPNPEALSGQEYFANPSPLDPSFDDDQREWHREGFRAHAGEHFKSGVAPR